MKRLSHVQLALSLTLLTAATSAAILQPAFAQEATPVEVSAPAEAAVDATPVPAEVPKEVETAQGDVVQVPPAQVIQKAETPAEVTNETFFASLANAVGQFKGASTLAIILIISQILIQFTKTAIFGHIFKKADDSLKLLIVTGLTCVTTVVGMMVQGMEFLAALLSGAALSAIMVFGHQIYLKWFAKKA